MKIELFNGESRDPEDLVARVDAQGNVELSDVFNGVGITTTDGNTFRAFQRDTGLEIRCPDGTVVGVKLDEAGDVVIERNCEQVASA